MTYTKEENERWVRQVAAYTLGRTGVDITDLVRDGPGRIIFNLCTQTDRLPGAFADQATVRHIMDWLVASKVRNEEWLSRLDVAGRPLKLMKCGTIERLTHEADKAMKRWNSKKTVDASVGTEVVFECSRGYKVCKLVTAEALDGESGAMAHCVGNGAYDEALEKGELEIYSLRDSAGKSRVTIEVDTRKRRIVEMMGKANTVVKPEYMRLLIEWFNHDRKLDLWETELPPGFEIDRNRKIVELAALRPGDTFDGDMHLRVFEDTDEFAVPLPDNFTVLGDLTISAHRRMDYNVGQEQPYDFHAPISGRDWIRESHGPILKVPAGLKAEGVLAIHGFRAGIEAKAYSYRLVACRIDYLPPSIDRSVVMTECHVPTALPGVRFGKNLVIDNCGDVEFADAVSINGEMTLSFTSGGHGRNVSMAMNGGCRVEGNLTATYASFEAGADVAVAGGVRFQGGVIAAERLVVDGDFVTNDTEFRRMPSDLKVGGDARFDWARIDRWPETMDVGGQIKDGGVTFLRAPASSQSQPRP